MIRKTGSASKSINSQISSLNDVGGNSFSKEAPLALEPIFACDEASPPPGILGAQSQRMQPILDMRLGIKTKASDAVRDSVELLHEKGC